MKIKNIIKYILKIPIKVIRKLIYILKKLYLQCYPMPKTPTVIISMDGGLCSQMYEYSIGEFFKKHGFHVRYDLSWFKEYGKDVLGKDVRMFELLKLYPNLKIKTISKINIERIRQDNYRSMKDLDDCLKEKKSLFLVNDAPITSYFDDIDKIKKNIYSNPRVPKDLINSKFLKEIMNCNQSCAVHVRRGDLANPEIALKSGYGNCVSDSYFINAINIMKEHFNNVKFFFFSDDLPYVRTVLIPLLGNINYSIVDENEATTKIGGAYKDFYLIQLCKHQICSLGSFGLEAAILNRNENKIVIGTRKNNYKIKNYVLLDSNGNYENKR